MKRPFIKIDAATYVFLACMMFAIFLAFAIQGLDSGNNSASELSDLPIAKQGSVQASE